MRCVGETSGENSWQDIEFNNSLKWFELHHRIPIVSSCLPSSPFRANKDKRLNANLSYRIQHVNLWMTDSLTTTLKNHSDRTKRASKREKISFAARRWSQKEKKWIGRQCWICTFSWNWIVFRKRLESPKLPSPFRALLLIQRNKLIFNRSSVRVPGGHPSTFHARKKGRKIWNHRKVWRWNGKCIKLFPCSHDYLLEEIMKRY